MTCARPVGRRSCAASSRSPSGSKRCGIPREVAREITMVASCGGCLRRSRKPGERVSSRLPPTGAFRSEASPRLRSHPRTRRGRTGTRNHDVMRRKRAEASSSASGSSSDSASFGDPSGGLRTALNAFWRFLRPHTIRGTVLGTTALVARVLMENPSSINWMLMPRALIGLLALLCGNGYIVGINQIYDEEIDRVNKPFLPVAAGDLTKSQAWILVAALAVGGLSAVLTQFGALTAKLYTLGLFLGTVYSVPPLRLKRFALPAFLIIATVRGVLLNFGVYHATREALLLPFQWSPAAAFITIFATVFATVIAITKDLADVEGDKKFNIGTFATALGVRGVAFLGSGLLFANYMGAILAACVASNGTYRMAMMVGAHALFALFLIKSTFKLDQARYTKSAVQEYYRAIWNLFYSETLALFAFLAKSLPWLEDWTVLNNLNACL